MDCKVERSLAKRGLISFNIAVPRNQVVLLPIRHHTYLDWTFPILPSAIAAAQLSQFSVINLSYCNRPYRLHENGYHDRNQAGSRPYWCGCISHRYIHFGSLASCSF